MERNLYWISVAAFALILILIYANDIKIKSSKQKGDKSFRQLILWCIFFCLQDMVWGMCFAGLIGNDAVLIVTSSIFHISAVVTTFFWLKYVFDFVGERGIARKTFMALDIAIICAETVLVVANFFVPLMFTVSDGEFVPGYWRQFTFYSQYLVYLLICIIALISTFRATGERQKKSYAILIFTLVPILLGVAQLAYPDGPFYSMAFFIGCVIVHMFVITEEREKALKEQEKQVKEIQEEREKVSEAFGMIEGLSKEYHTIWVVSKETSKMRLVRSSGKSTIKRAVQMGIDEPAFDPAFATYIGSCVEPEDRERMHREIAFAEVLRHLQENPDKIYAVNYLRRDDSGHVGYHQIAFANADTKEGKKQFVYGFRDIDALVKEEQKQKEDLQDALSKAQDSAAEQEAQLEEITALNAQLENNQAELEASAAEQESQLKEISELNHNLAEYSNAMTNAGYGLWHIILKDGVSPKMRVNKKMAELLGVAEQNLTEEEMYNAWYGQIVPEAIPSVQSSVSEMMAGNFSENTYQWIHPTKGTIYVRCGGTAKKLEDGTNVLSGYHCDVTDIVREEKRHNKELEAAKKAAESANKAKTSFLFNMSHDIRTPMNAIIGYTNLVVKHYDDKQKSMNYLHKTQQANQFLLSLINDVLEMARIESGKARLNFSVCPVGCIARESASIFEEQMAKKGINYSSHVETHSKWAFYDQAKVREVYLNLLSNALKYTPEGGSVTMDAKEIPSDKPGYIQMQVTFADTGIGMSKEFLPHLYEEFTREHTATESRQQGTGLGMPIVKRILDMMGGTIDVESELGKGTKFTVTYPLKVEGAVPPEEEKGQIVENLDFSGKRILLAEDNDLNAEIATEILTEAGFHVNRAEDGAVCVKMLEDSLDGYFDIILMDVQMPNMDGYQATRAIRQLSDPLKANIPIIAVTANAFDEDKRNALDAGMNGHIAKPIEVPKLMTAISEVFSK